MAIDRVSRGRERLRRRASRAAGSPSPGPRPIVVALVAIAALLVPASSRADNDDPLPTEVRAWLDDHGPVRVGWSAVLRPVSIVDDGEVVGGYAVEAWDLGARRLGVQLEHVAYPDAPALGAALDSGEIDVVGALGSHPAVAEGRQSTEPLAWVPGVFVGLPEQAPLGVDDLSGRTFSTLPGAVIRAEVEEAHPGGTHVPTDGPVAGLQAVAAGEIDLFFGPLALLGHQIGRLGLPLVPIGDFEGLNTVQAWSEPASPASQVADLVRERLSDTDLAVLHVLWTGFDLTEPDEGSSIPGWLVPTALGLGLATLVFAAAAFVLRRRVAAATAELRDVNEGLEEIVEERTDSLVASNQALRRFASTAAHDLKGPVTAIGGMTELLTHDVVDDDHRRAMLERVGANATRLTTMIDAMLDDAMRVGVSADRIEGAAFERWLSDVTSAEFDVIDACLDVDVPHRPLDLDAEVLRRASMNLVGNAAKYAVNEDGTRCAVSLTRDDDEWRLTVADNGPGVPRDQWATVFDRGARLVHDERGFGLGLAAIRDLVQGAGGSISVGESQLGGAAFRVVLPAFGDDALDQCEDDQVDVSV